MNKTKVMAFTALVALSGCIKDMHNPTCGNGEAQSDVKTNAAARYLCVGMETSKRFGSCPGCAIDALQMNTILSDALGYRGEMLISSQATKSAVVSKLKSGIDATPEDGLFLFCYSGHGGQEYIGGKEPDGSDAEDEFLCLYDTYMLDDEIWDIVSKCKGRVFLYFDACHSATMYRSISSDISTAGVAKALSAGMVKTKGFTFTPKAISHARSMSASDGKVRMLCWSGCKEEEYSYGGSNGGVLTRALAKNWRKNITYGALWPLIVKDVQKEQPTQHPCQTMVGSGFVDVEALR